MYPEVIYKIYKSGNRGEVWFYQDRRIYKLQFLLDFNCKVPKLTAVDSMQDSAYWRKVWCEDRYRLKRYNREYYHKRKRLPRLAP